MCLNLLQFNIFMCVLRCYIKETDKRLIKCNLRFTNWLDVKHLFITAQKPLKYWLWMETFPILLNLYHLRPLTEHLQKYRINLLLEYLSTLFTVKTFCKISWCNEIFFFKLNFIFFFFLLQWLYESSCLLYNLSSMHTDLMHSNYVRRVLVKCWQTYFG